MGHLSRHSATTANGPTYLLTVRASSAKCSRLRSALYRQPNERVVSRIAKPLKVEPIYGVLDLTREGRGDSAAYAGKSKPWAAQRLPGPARERNWSSVKNLKAIEWAG